MILSCERILISFMFYLFHKSFNSSSFAIKQNYIIYKTYLEKKSLLKKKQKKNKKQKTYVQFFSHNCNSETIYKNKGSNSIIIIQ